MARHDNKQPVYDAAQKWRDNSLLNGFSVFYSSSKIWTKPRLEELDKHFVQNPDAGDGVFLTKLKTQLSKGSPFSRQLMAEIIWILRLFSTNIKAETKRKQVYEVWSWSDINMNEHDPLLEDSVLEGIGSTGAAFNTKFWLEINFFIGAIRAFKELSPEKQNEIATDPWKFSEWFGKQPDAQNRQAIHVIQHLLFPESFENSSAKSEKIQILSRFNDVPEKSMEDWDTTKIDRSLLELRNTLAKKYGDGFDFYSEKHISKWRNQTFAEASLEKMEQSQEIVNKIADVLKEFYGSAAEWKSYVKSLGEAVTLFPGNAKAWYWLGELQRRLGDYNESIASLDKAILLSPNEYQSFDARGLAKYGAGIYDDAIDDFEKSIEIKSDSAPAWYGLGAVKIKTGEYQDAISHLERAIGVDSKYWPAYREMGIAKGEMGQHQSAISNLEDAKRLHENDFLTFFYLGDFQCRLEKYHEGIESLNRSINLNPNYAPAWHIRGRAKADNGRIDEAMKDIEKAVRLEPNNFDIINTQAALRAEVKSQDVLEKRLGSLADTEELDKLRMAYKAEKEKNERLINRSLICLFSLIVAFIILVAVLYSILGLTPDKYNPFSLWPWFATVLLLTSPVVWGIRILIQRANKAELMESEYLHLSYVEKRMLFYFAKNNDSQSMKIREDYIKETMANSPSNKLLVMNKGKSDIGISSVIRDELQKRNEKG